MCWCVCVVRGVVLCGCVCVVASVWWCLCGGGMVVFLCLCDGVFFCFAVVFLRRNYAKSVDNTGVKRYPV